MISSVLLAAIVMGLAVLMLTAALSPLETLSWWAGWTDADAVDDDDAPDPADAAPAVAAPNAKTYVVYLSGVASISGEFLLPRELAFIRKLRDRMPDAALITNVFPYSPRGMALLAAPRLLERVWRRAQQFKVGGRQSLLTMLINIRNILQVMVSADHRYGPIFNQGAARVIETALREEGLRHGERARIIIIGYSGGAQIAAGAAPFLTVRLGASVEIIALGGVMASDPGVSYLRKLHHITGDKDRVHKAAALMFPERWPLLAHSEWNVAVREGRIERHTLAGMSHAGVGGYFGRPPINGVSNGERTANLVASLIARKN